MLQAKSKVGIGKSTVTSKRGCKVTQQRMWIQAGGKKIGDNSAIYHRFFFPWRKQLLPGSWPGIEVSDRESQWESKLKYDVALLNWDRLSP